MSPRNISILAPRCWNWLLPTIVKSYLLALGIFMTSISPYVSTSSPVDLQCLVTHGVLLKNHNGGIVRATSHTRLRTRDHCTSSTLIGGKGGAGASSLHTMLEGPTEYVNARWMYIRLGFLHGIKWIMFHGELDYFQKASLGGRLNKKIIGRPWHSEHSQLLIYLIWSCMRTRVNRNSLK